MSETTIVKVGTYFFQMANPSLAEAAQDWVNREHIDHAGFIARYPDAACVSQLGGAMNSSWHVVQR